MRKPNLIPELEPYWNEYTDEKYQRTMKPVKVVFEMASPILGYDHIMFDSLLARLVVDEATGGIGLDDTQSPFLLPVPLKLIWKNGGGFPLWAANSIDPLTEAVDITEYHHKRFVREEHGKLKKGVKKSAITSKKGRFKEKRMQIPGKYAEFWGCTCIGDIEEIHRLLSSVSSIGKKRAGSIKNMYIGGISEFNFNRFVPLQFLIDYNDGNVDFYGGIDKLHQFSLEMAEKSWTPPYWVGVPETRTNCVFLGEAK